MGKGGSQTILVDTVDLCSSLMFTSSIVMGRSGAVSFNGRGRDVSCHVAIASGTGLMVGTASASHPHLALTSNNKLSVAKKGMAVGNPLGFLLGNAKFLGISGTNDRLCTSSLCRSGSNVERSHNCFGISGNNGVRIGNADHLACLRKGIDNRNDRMGSGAFFVNICNDCNNGRCLSIGGNNRIGTHRRVDLNCCSRHSSAALIMSSKNGVSTPGVDLDAGSRLTLNTRRKDTTGTTKVVSTRGVRFI